MKIATLVSGKVFRNSGNYEVAQNVYRLDPPCNGYAEVVVSHVDPDDGCDPTGLFLGYDENDWEAGERTYFQDVMTDDEVLRTLGYLVDRA